MNDFLEIGNIKLKSRLFTGSGKYSDDSIIPDVLESSGSQVITVALRRVDFNANENVMTHIPKDTVLLPNTSGARNSEEAIRIARLARSAGCGDWIKIEVIPDNRYLMPDGYETVKATEVLANEGFIVLPYINPDLIIGKQLHSAGAAAVMPLGSPIGSNRGFRTEEIVRIMIEEIDLPIIVDAGIGKPSDATKAMEMGAAACLVNTAIAVADNPVLMGRAFGNAVKSGRDGFLAGIGAQNTNASASSPLTGFLDE
ncbi:MAG: thiazole synthase [Desulfobacterales bacterium]|nr:thiazole synthase [Desulfobacterales bacterium]